MTRMPKNEPLLPKSVQVAIEKAIKSYGTAVVSRDRHGNYHVQKEKREKVPIEAPAAVNGRL